MAKLVMPDDFKSVSEVFNNDKAFEKVRQVARENDAIEKFAEIFPELVKICHPVKINTGVLFVKVENSVWKNELNLKRSLLIERINKHLSTEAVKKIRFL